MRALVACVAVFVSLYAAFSIGLHWGVRLGIDATLEIMPPVIEVCHFLPV